MATSTTLFRRESYDAYCNRELRADGWWFVAIPVFGWITILVLCCVLLPAGYLFGINVRYMAVTKQRRVNA